LSRRLQTNPISDPKLAEQGRRFYEWAASRMTILEKLAAKNCAKKPLAGFKLGLCLHVTKETSVLAMAAKSLGAEIAICSANPLSVQNDVAAFLSSQGIRTFAWRGETKEEYDQCISSVLDTKPDIVTDDGGDLHTAAHKSRTKSIVGGTEETTSGVKRLQSMQRHGRLAYPVIAVNNAHTKHLFDNRYGTGQSTIDGIQRSAGVLFAGKHMVVSGYGWVGKGVAARAKGMGANVTITEVDPVKALEARMDGFDVMKLSEVAPYGDIFVTCTGQTSIIRKEHFVKMKNGAILANAGHFDVEINIQDLHSVADAQPQTVRQDVEEFLVRGRKIYLLAKGRVVNLVAASGNPSEIMALSFANQLLSILHIAKNHDMMEPKLYDVPEEIDAVVARYALEAMGIKIDRQTEKQKKYQS
jgi:adenosylhomocysteinase